MQTGNSVDLQILKALLPAQFHVPLGQKAISILVRTTGKMTQKVDCPVKNTRMKSHYRH